jgi:hypothetical protein
MENFETDGETMTIAPKEERKGASIHLTRRTKERSKDKISLKEMIGKLYLPNSPVEHGDDILALSCMLFAKAIDDSVAYKNKIAGYIRSRATSKGDEKYKLPQEIMDIMDLQLKEIEANKKERRKFAELACAQHPVSSKVGQIRGLSPVYVGLIMRHIKRAERFPTFGKLKVYAGLAAINGNKLTKASLSDAKEYYHERGEQLQGFNTQMSKLFQIITDCLIKSKGFFYVKFTDYRKRLTTESIKSGKAVLFTEEEKALKLPADKGKEVGRYYIVGRKNQSLEMFTMSGARWRIASIVLYLIYKEMATHEGWEVREPYCEAYLGHTSIITLEEVVEKEARMKLPPIEESDDDSFDQLAVDPTE